MKSTVKYFLCATFCVALSFCMIINVFGASSDYLKYYKFGGVAPPFMSVSQYDFGNDVPQTVESDSLTNEAVDSFTFSDYGFNVVGGDSLRSYPLVISPFYQLTYNDRGSSFVRKSWNPYDLGYVGALCTSLEFCVMFGVQTTSQGSLRYFMDIDTLHIQESSLSYDLSSLGKFEVVQKGGFDISLNTVYGSIPFDIVIYKVSFNFFEPFDLSLLGDSFITCYLGFNWEGLPNYFIRLTSAISPFGISYILEEDKEEYKQSVVIENNNNTLDGFKGDLDDLKNDLALETLVSSEIGALFDRIEEGKLNEVDNLLGFGGGDNYPNSKFQRLLTSVAISSLGVAFIGYVLHGKKA